MKEDFKNIIKQTADNHSDDINPDMIWAGIETKLGQKKKKRFAGYWIFGGFSIVAVFLIYAFLWSAEDSIVKSNSANYATTDEVNEDVVVNGVNGEVETEIESEIVGVGSSNDLENVKKEEIEFDVLKRVISNELQDGGNKISVSKSIRTIHRSSKLDDPIFDLETSIKGVGNDLSLIPLVKENRASNILNEIENRALLSISQAKSIRFDGLVVNDRHLKLANYEAFVFESPYVSDENKIVFLSGVELYSGLSFGDKSVSDADQSYVKSRNDTEQLLEQWSTGVRFDLLKVLDFQLHSGMRYAMITDRMQMVNEYKDLTEYIYVKSRLVGDAIVVIDSMVVVDSIPQNFAYTTEQYNSQRLISIPLEVSFGKTLGKFDLGLGFGVDINYQLADTHVILNQEGKASVNKVGGNWVSPSFSGALLAGYHFNDKWSITSRINFRGLSLSDHESINTLRSNYKLYGLELGLKRNFGN